MVEAGKDSGPPRWSGAQFHGCEHEGIKLTELYISIRSREGETLRRRPNPRLLLESKEGKKKQKTDEKSGKAEADMERVGGRR